MPTLQEIQDATLLINAFEEKSTRSLSEESAFVAAARIVNMMKDEMKTIQKAFIPQSKLSDDLLTQGNIGQDGLLDKMREHLGSLGIDQEKIDLAIESGSGDQTEGTEDVTGSIDWQDIEKISMSYLRDCVPCIDRIKQLQPATAVLPFDLFNAILDDLRSRMQWLWEILDLLGDTSVWNDTCHLMQFLSFMCVPDLAGLITFLSFIATKYNAHAMTNMNMLPGFWISQAFYAPFMMAVYAVIARYVGQINGIVKCISVSLQKQIGKLDVERPLNRLMDPSANKKTSMMKASSDIRKTDKAVGDSLNLMLESIKKGFGFVDKEMREGADTIKNFLSGGDTSNWSVAEYIRTKMVLARLIGFVRFMIEMIVSGGKDWEIESDGLRGFRVKCDGPDEAYDKMMQEFERFARGAIDSRVQLERDDNGNITDVSWHPIPDPSALEEAGNKWKDEFLPDAAAESLESQTKSLSDDPDDNVEIRDKITELVQRKINISCSGIGEILSAEDTSKLQQWFADLAN